MSARGVHVQLEEMAQRYELSVDEDRQSTSDFHVNMNLCLVYAGMAFFG